MNCFFRVTNIKNFINLKKKHKNNIMWMRREHTYLRAITFHGGYWQDK